MERKAVGLPILLTFRSPRHGRVIFLDSFGSLPEFPRTNLAGTALYPVQQPPLQVPDHRGC